MYKNYYWLKSLIFLLFLSFSHHISAQKLIESRQSSFYTYIYQITDAQAKEIYQENNWKFDSALFRTKIDSFPTDKEYERNLPQGHYIKAWSEQNNLKIAISSVHNFEVFIFNNNTDLKVQVYDLNGAIIKDAEVKVSWKKLRFHSKTQSYLDRKSNQKGVLEVAHNGFTAYYNLSRELNNPAIKRVGRKVVYQTSLKYVWIPVNFILHIPYDGVRSILDGWPRGTIYQTKNFFVKLYYKTICLFDEYYCDYYSENNFTDKHTGYIAFNKPKYLPDDTVKLKAFVVKKNGKPINKEVELILQTDRKSVRLAQLKPYRNGGYAYDFVLHDSLQLKLDRSYAIGLQLNYNKEYINGSFRYEDYELAKNKLSLRAEGAEHFGSKQLKIYAKGLDVNELNVLDARLQILISPVTVNKYYEDEIFISDTIQFMEKKLDPTGETEIILSDSEFPKIDFEYNINVKMLTSDNEVVSENKKIKYYYQKEEFKMNLKSDSIQFTFEKDGVQEKRNVAINAVDNFGNKSLVFEGELPVTIKLNPYYSSYAVQSDQLEQNFDISSMPPLLQCFSERSSGLLEITVDNPRNIPFSYNIYKKNRQVASGYTDSLKLEKKTFTKQNYFISIQYLWGGEVRNESYRIPLMDKKLNITAIQPQIVYPGQNTTIELLVTDNDGEPVKGVDLTAYSLTKKFNYTPPAVPDLSKERKNKTVINNFDFEEFDRMNNNKLPLDYDAWKTSAGIDSIAYYQFSYPENSIRRFEYTAPDSLTQFAPFVFSKGEAQTIHVIYVDSKPVYFSWSTHTQPYSFKIDSGYHQVKLRTAKRNIVIDSLYFKQCERLVFSVDQDSGHEKVYVRTAESELSGAEKSLLYKYIFPYKDIFGGGFAFISQGEDIQFLNASTESKSHFRRNDNFAGPIVGSVKFQMLNDFDLTFYHEPYFEYEFNSKLLKMRSIDRGRYPHYLNNYNPVQSLEDSVLTKDALNLHWKEYVNAKRYLSARYHYPSSTSKGAGRLLIRNSDIDQNKIEQPLNLLVFRYDDHEFLRVYPGNTQLLHELDAGLHQLIFFYSGSKYHIEDSVNIEVNGLNYYEYSQPEILKQDSFSLTVSKLIENNLFKYRPDDKDEEKELSNIYSSYRKNFQYSGVGEIVEGYVYDADTNEPLPGVNVIIKGTTFGTITDLDGYYSLTVPYGKEVLQISFIGFARQEVNINNNPDVYLEADVQQLSEVVVTGYGIGRESRQKMSTSVATQKLAGSVAGVSINHSGTPGSAVEITIRGASTTAFDNKPLYIINGSVFTGDISDLDPEVIQSIEILKGAAATAMYGANGANGVVIMQTKTGTFQPTPSSKGADYDDSFYEAASQSSSIRNNFSDYAFWQPRLLTDNEGKAKFEVSFPDDVTSWETHYLAMNGKRQTGQSQKLIKSYKPLMAQLALPRFMVEKDSSYAIGKVLNYSPDSVEVTTQFELNKELQLTKQKYVTNSLIDTLTIMATSDSLSVKYFLEKEDGYFDGEQRNIPVYPIGLEETKGNFYYLDKDTTIQLSFDSNLGEVSLFARADVLEVMEDEISHLISYEYSCNEQLASKLKALIAERKIADYKGTKFKNEKQVEKIIRLITKNQKNTGLWGWWKNSSESEWISLHVLEALVYAEALEYVSKIDKEQITERLIYLLERGPDFERSVRILKILNLLEAQVAYASYISNLEKNNELSLNGLLQLTHLKQLSQMNFDADTIKTYSKKTMLGNIYFANEFQQSGLLINDLQNTLLAYKILKADSMDNEKALGKIRNYFLENRNNGYWRNTYESAQIIETILPDLLGDTSELVKPSLTLKGDVNKTISSFPFEMKVNPSQQIELTKKGDFPVYFTSYQRFWNKEPSLKKDDFVIETVFSEDVNNILTGGKEIKLIVNVSVKKDAEYVMINVPIPAGCSYVEKRNNFRNESHREYFKNKTTVFCEKLPKGDYTFEVDLLPRYSGSYTLNPAKIEDMYFPVFNGNNEKKRVKVN